MRPYQQCLLCLLILLSFCHTTSAMYLLSPSFLKRQCLNTLLALGVAVSSGKSQLLTSRYRTGEPSTLKPLHPCIDVSYDPPVVCVDSHQSFRCASQAVHNVEHRETREKTSVEVFINDCGNRLKDCYNTNKEVIKDLERLQNLKETENLQLVTDDNLVIKNKPREGKYIDDKANKLSIPFKIDCIRKTR